MENKDYTYKSNHIFAPLPSCTLTIHYFKKLYEILNKITKEAAEIEITKLTKAPNQSDEDFDKLKNYARSLYQLSIQIFGQKGEYIFSDSDSIFNEARLPDRITKIIFDNSIKYNFNLKKDPLNKVRLEFDFTKVKVFDFVTSPSRATTNTSTIRISGENETWVSGAYKNVIQSLKERANKWSWLHSANIYDLFIWLIVIPLGFFTIYKIERIFSLSTSGMSTVFIAAIYLYFFTIVLNIFRMIFNYARWIFPKMELVTSLKKGATVHRVILGAILLAILCSYIYDLLKLIF